jgi:hypothetical protein
MSPEEMPMEPASHAVGEPPKSAAWTGRLQVAIVLSLCAMLLGVAGFAAYGLSIRHRAIGEQAEQSAAGLAHILTAQLSTELDAVAATLEQLAAYSRRNGGPSSAGEAWIQLLAATHAGLPAAGSLSVTDSSGDVTFASPTDAMGDDYADSRMFAALSANPMNDALVVDPPARSPVDGRWVLPVARVNRAPSGDIEGIVVATIAPSRLADFYRSADIGPGGVLWVLSPAGEVLLREPSAGNITQEPWPNLPLDAAKSASENSGIVHAPIEAGGEPFLTAYETSVKAPLTVAVSRSESAIFAAWWEEVRATILGLAALALLLAAIGLGLTQALRSRA